jgi:O-antigen/teichoic acid export membrane protein
MILVPAVVIMLLGGDKLLLIFGGNYAREALDVLLVLTVSTLPAAVADIYLSIARVKRRLWALVMVPASMTVVTLGGGYLLTPRMGILGPAVAWLAIQVVVAIAVLPGIVKLARGGRFATTAAAAVPGE